MATFLKVYTNIVFDALKITSRVILLNLWRLILTHHKKLNLSKLDSSKIDLTITITRVMIRKD